MLAGTQADIVFLVDESRSGSEASTQKWLAALVTGDFNSNGNNSDPGDKPSLAETFDAFGIDDLRYGLVGFGEDEDQFTRRYAHSQLFDLVGGAPDSLFGDPTSATSSGPNDPYVDTAALDVVFGTKGFGGNLAHFGGEEDGWDALEHVVSEYEFRDGAVPIVILVQNDEGRSKLNDTLTHEGVLAALESKNIILNSMIVGETTNFVIDPYSADWDPVFEVDGFNGRVFGVEADNRYWGYDSGTTSGQFDPQNDTLAGSTSLPGFYACL